MGGHIKKIQRKTDGRELSGKRSSFNDEQMMSVQRFGLLCFSDNESIVGNVEDERGKSLWERAIGKSGRGKKRHGENRSPKES